MKVAQVPAPGADFQIVEREIPTPGEGHVRIKVQACGVCHSDALTKEGSWPGIQYPRVPGHEVAGIIDELGAGVSAWKQGQRVGVGWHGGRHSGAFPGDLVHRQQSDERSKGIARTGRREGHSSDSSKLESDVRVGRRFGAERQAHGNRCFIRSY